LDPASLNRLQQVIGFLDSSLRLPDNPRTFAIYLSGLVIVFIGAFLQVLVSAQIMQAEITLARLQDQYRELEQINGDLAFQLAYETNMNRLHERIVANGYVPVEERQYIFRPNEMVAATQNPVQGTAESLTENNPGIGNPGIGIVAVAALATTQEPVAATEPLQPAEADLGHSSNLGGQVARWEEFWNQTWRTATGSSATQNAATPNTAAGSVLPSDASPNFWAVWWEQASDQGAKLLDQLRSQ
jgi:hypothetical protein